MTENTETAAITTTEVEPETAETTDDSTTTEAGKGGRREAKYRRQLRDTEAERDTLRSTVETLQRAEAERLSSLDKPAALWAAGTTLADVLDDDGTVDPEKVKAAADAAADALGAAPRSGTPRPDRTQGGHGTLEIAPSFADAFAPKK